jgi:hypothetical protein
MTLSATRDALKGAVLAFVRHWDRHEAHPFRWTFRGFRKKVAGALAA